MKERIKLLGMSFLTIICSVFLGITIANAESVASSLTIKSSDYNSPPMSFPQTFHVKKTSSGKWAYCITYAKKTPYSGVKYKKADIVDDRGKYYILKEAEKNVNSKSDFFIYQTALWIYMSDKGIMNDSYSVSKFRSKVYNSSSSTAKKIRSIVAAAKSAPKIDKSAPTINLSVSNNEMSLSGSKYVSKKIKLKSSTSSYKITFSNAPKGTTYKVSGGYLYVYVPKSSVTSLNTSFKVKASNSKTIYNGQNYSPNNSKYQKMAVVFKETKSASSAITLKIHRVVDVKVSKQKITNSKELPGATLIVKNSDGKQIDKWKSTTKVHIVKGLKNGTYTLTETIAPDGYKLSTETVKFKIDKNGKLTNASGKAISQVVMKNEVTDVKISKQSVTSTEELPGATLVLKNANGTVVEKWTSTNKVHHVKALKVGTYTLTETIAPNGFKLSTETIKFTLDKYGKLTDANGKSISQVVMKNELTKDVDISKQAVTGGSELPGATLVLKNANGKEIEKWVSTDKVHTVKGLGSGTYTLTETIAPNGYKLSEETIKFTLDKYGKLTDANGKSIDKVIMKNELTDVKISKQAVTGGSELPGATLILKNIDGTEVEKWVSTDQVHHVKGLKAGTYTLTETIAPDGYKLSEETIKFTLDKYGKLTDANGKSISQVVMKNELTDVKISKQAITGGSELPGATLILKSIDGTEVEKWVSTNQVHHVKGLKAGTYTLTETIAPNGYKLSEETIKFTLDKYGKLTDENGNPIDQVVMKNELTDVKISKQAITGGSELPGATLILKSIDGKEIEKWVSTDQVHHVKGLGAGTYTLTETIAPNGYKLSEETIKFTLDKYGKLTDENGNSIDQVVMKNELTDVKISKQDITTNKELPGAKLVLKNKEGKTVDSWTSTDGIHNIKGLSAGTYILSETMAPVGYVETKETVEFTIDKYGKLTDKNGNAIEKVIMYNTPQKELNIEISKQDITTKTELPGATLLLTDKDGKTIDTWVSTNETHIVKYIIAGTYTLTETVAPNGYKLSEQKIIFTIDKDGKITDESGKEIEKVVMYNELKDKRPIKISKQDITTKTELPGASLTVTDKDNNVIATWVSTNEEYIIEDIEPGTYTLIETAAPNGFVLSTEKIKFTIDKNGKITDESGKEIEKVVMYNKPTDKKNVTISKQDIATSKELPGASLEVTDVNGNVIDSWVSTNESHVIKDIKAGTYTLTETKAPENYILSTEKITFTIDENGKITNEKGQEVNKIIMYNEVKKPKDVTISKQDIATSKELPGASLEVTDVNGNVIDSWVSTNESHVIKDIKAGTYTLTETKAPENYILSTEKITFTIDENGILTNAAGAKIDKVVMLNKPVPKTNVTISKQDITTSKELPGASLTVKDASGNIIDSWVSTNEPHIIKDLVAGTYTLTETQAPSNYILSTETITFTVDENSKLVNSNGKCIDKVIMYNEKEVKPFNVPIVKQDAKTRKVLSGATLEVKDAEGKTIDSWTTTTDAHYLELLAGTYTLTETSAPKGYILNNIPITFIVNEEGFITDVNGNKINTVIMDNTPVETKVSISKQDITNGEEIPGATLVVKDANGNVIDTWTSTTTPHLITGLVPGEYTLNEVIAPNGYILSDETITFTVKEDGSVTSVVMYNTPKPETPETPENPTIPSTPTQVGKEIKVENTASSKTIVPTLIGGLFMGLGTLTIKRKRKELI